MVTINAFLRSCSSSVASHSFMNSWCIHDVSVSPLYWYILAVMPSGHSGFLVSALWLFWWPHPVWGASSFSRMEGVHSSYCFCIDGSWSVQQLLEVFLSSFHVLWLLCEDGCTILAWQLWSALFQWTIYDLDCLIEASRVITVGKSFWIFGLVLPPMVFHCSKLPLQSWFCTKKSAFLGSWVRVLEMNLMCGCLSSKEILHRLVTLIKPVLMFVLDFPQGV